VKSRTEICIVGAGLSGLSLASRLLAEGRNVTVLEGRDRAGGRVLSERGYDLGPAWVWPHNRRMLALADQLGLGLFPQHAQGRLVFEAADGAIRRDLEFATMGGALRIEGGLARVTDALAKDLGDRLCLGQPVRRVTEDADGVTLTCDTAECRADRVVLALPPRLIGGLGIAVPDAPTWMAGHAKLVAIYPTAFWRDDGLNGDAISHQGPLAEIHDACLAEGGEGALFGFAHPGATAHPQFRQAALAQLERLFGPGAATPRDVIVKDWSADPATATQADRTPPTSHPAYRAIAPTARLIFAGTEASADDGGFLEGALAAAEAAYMRLGQPVA